MSAIPPKIEPSGMHPWMLPALAGGVAVLAILFFFNPATCHFYPVCQFHRLTGLNCPGCGMTRAAHSLLHGDPAAALRQNALLVLLIPAGAVRGIWYWRRQRTDGSARYLPAKGLWGLAGAALVFTIIRNHSAGVFLNP